MKNKFAISILLSTLSISAIMYFKKCTIPLDQFRFRYAQSRNDKMYELPDKKIILHAFKHLDRPAFNYFIEKSGILYLIDKRQLSEAGIFNSVEIGYREYEKYMRDHYNHPRLEYWLGKDREMQLQLVDAIISVSKEVDELSIAHPKEDLFSAKE